MVQATSNSENFDAEQLKEAIQEGEVQKKDVSAGNFDSDYELAQEFATPESNTSGTGSNQSPEAGSETGPFAGNANEPGNPAAFREIAHEVQPEQESR